jgi:hypothetical protein
MDGWSGERSTYIRQQNDFSDAQMLCTFQRVSNGAVIGIVRTDDSIHFYVRKDGDWVSATLRTDTSNQRHEGATT